MSCCIVQHLNLMKHSYLLLLVNASAMTIDQASKLVVLLGENITHLDVSFLRDSEFTPKLAHAVCGLAHLKVFTYEYCGPWSDHEDDQFLHLVKAAPNLEALTCHRHHPLKMPLSSSNFSKLRYLNFRFNDKPLPGIRDICELAKKTLKVIECSPDHPGCDIEGEEIVSAIKPVCKTLEGLFTGFPDLLEDVVDIEFPRLRVVSVKGFRQIPGNMLWSYSLWPMLRHVRTLVFDYEFSKKHWLLFFRYHEAQDLSEFLVPNLKCCLFHVKQSGSIDKRIVDAFLGLGISCHEIGALSPLQIMVRVAKQISGFSISQLIIIPLSPPSKNKPTKTNANTMNRQWMKSSTALEIRKRKVAVLFTSITQWTNGLAFVLARQML